MTIGNMPTDRRSDSISQAVEEWFGITADPDNVQKLQAYLRETYGTENPLTLKKVFLSGEAAGFLTVNETYFFREPAHFSFLWDFLPAFEKYGLRICSAATATGCEAYSIAMLIEAYNHSAKNPLLYHIDAFDINPQVIEIARKGDYNTRTLREDGSRFHYMIQPFIQKSEKLYHIDQSLQKNISFFVHNLMDQFPSQGYDFIFFRNAFIYLTPGGRGRSLTNLCASLKDGGILIMGVSETAGVQHSDLESKNRGDVFYFQKNT